MNTPIPPFGTPAFSEWIAKKFKEQREINRLKEEADRRTLEKERPEFAHWLKLQEDKEYGTERRLELEEMTKRYNAQVIETAELKAHLEMLKDAFLHGKMIEL